MTCFVWQTRIIRRVLEKGFLKMAFFPIFLSVVVVLRNQSAHIKKILPEITRNLSCLVSDYELIVVDNASDDDSIDTLKGLTTEGGLPNLQVYALTKEVNADTASWVGLENALGDFMVVMDPVQDDIAFLPAMLDRAVTGIDMVFVNNSPLQSLRDYGLYAFVNRFFDWLKRFSLIQETPRYRVLAKRVLNFILQHPQPVIIYRYLSSIGGFREVTLTHTPLKVLRSQGLWDNVDRGIQLLVSTTRVPMRLVTIFSLFGAVANLVYSFYVVAIGFLKTDVAPGWISLSLQQSGMFFLISLVLFVLGEYILHMASLSNEGPLYHIGQEFTSARITRKEKLNIEEAVSALSFPSVQLE